MDAFERVVAELFWVGNYWVRTSVKVELTKLEKAELDNHSMPRPEIDLVAYRAVDNELLALECKSYLNSRGVTFAEVCGDKKTGTYKLFRDSRLREMVLDRLRCQMIAKGLVPADVTVRLGMVAGRVAGKDEPKLAALFEEKGWFFRGPAWLKHELGRFAGLGYENEVAVVVTKLLLNK